jgi:uncharacterized protein (TIGR03083 family)
MLARYRADVVIEQRDQISQFTADLRSLVAAGRTGPAEAPVGACPGWTVARLCIHVGSLARWATEVLRAPGPFDVKQLERAPKGAEVDYLAAGIAPLLAAVEQCAPAAQVWTWAGPSTGRGWWTRRLMHEIAVHRWDGEAAVGAPAPIPTDVAIDGIDELFELFVPRRIAQHDGTDVGGSIHLHCTDGDGEWTFNTFDGVFSLTHGHAKGDCAVRGPASALLLMQWGRIPVDDPSVERFGNLEVLARWMALQPSN